MYNLLYVDFYDVFTIQVVRFKKGKEKMKLVEFKWKEVQNKIRRFR